MYRVCPSVRSLARALGWLLALALSAPLAFGVSPAPQPLELPEVVVRGIDRVRLEAERAGVLPLEAPRLAQAPTRLELASAVPPPPELAAAPRVQSPGCAYRNPVSGALARATGGAEALYHTGMERLSRNLLDEAAGYLAQLRADHPAHPRADDAAFWLAEIRRRQGRLDEAVAFLGLVRGALAPEAAYRRAWMLADRGRGDEARRAWEELSRDEGNPHRPEALYRLGAAHYEAGAPRLALPPLEELAALPGQGVSVPGPVRAAGLLTLGLARRAAGNPRGAEEALVRFLLEAPDHPSAPGAQVALGWTLLEQGKSREAARRFGWIVDAAAPFPAELLGPALYGRLRALAEAQDPAMPDALLALEAGAPTGPWVGWGRADAGWLAFRQQRYEDALALYRSALRAWDAPGADVPRYMAAEALYLLGRYDEAAQAYRAVPPEAPLGPAALHRAGLCELLAGRPARAAELLEEALRRDPAYPETDRVWAWLGEARLRLGLRDEALRAFQAVPEHSPSHPQALYGRAWLAFDGARWDEAAELFARLLRSYPADPNRDEAVLNLARAHFNRREPRAALDALDRLERETGEPRYRSAARFYRGWMFARSGREAQARVQLAGLLADEPDGPYAAQAHHALGWLDFAAGAYAEALPHFDEALAREPHGPLADEARQKRADSLYNLGRYAEALEAYAALGDAPDAHYGQALSLFRLGRREELARAAQDFAARHPQDPRGAGLFLVLAQARAEAGEPAAAAAAYRRAAALAPEADRAAQARLEAARSHLQAEEWGPARELLEPLSALEGPVGLAALRELARLFDRQGPAGAARGAWDELARRTRGEERCRARRSAAAAARAVLDWEGAEERIRAALTECAASPALLRQAVLADLGEVLLLAGRPDAAAEPLAAAAEVGTSPEGLRALQTLARALEAAGRGQEALETYLRIGYLYPMSDSEAAGAFLRAGRLLEAQGQIDQARAVYEKVAGGAGEGPAREAREHLARLGVPADPR